MLLYVDFGSALLQQNLYNESSKFFVSAQIPDQKNRLLQRRPPRHTTPFFSRPQLTSQFTIISSRVFLFFVRHCLHSFLKYFTLLYSNFEPHHVSCNVLKYFILFIFLKKNILWLYSRHKTIHVNFYFRIPGANQNHALTKIMLIFSCRW